jgi:hypothetical protein
MNRFGTYRMEVVVTPIEGSTVNFKERDLYFGMGLCLSYTGRKYDGTVIIEGKEAHLRKLMGQHNFKIAVPIHAAPRSIPTAGVPVQ